MRYSFPTDAISVIVRTIGETLFAQHRIDTSIRDILNKVADLQAPIDFLPFFTLAHSK